MTIAGIMILCLSVLHANDRLSTLYFASKTTHHLPITSATFERSTELFERLLRTPNKHLSSSNLLRQTGLILSKTQEGFIVISEQKSRGNGFFVINPHPDAGGMLSIPHRYYDKKTGRIGLAMIRAKTHKAAAFNTVHRRVMDAAHTHLTLFNAFHLAYANVYPDDTIYQIHGFNAKKRRATLAQIGRAHV